MSINKKSSSAPPDPEKVADALSNNVLREMINELEETKLSLLLNIKELKEKLAQQKDDQADIYFYLNKKCDEGFEVIASLEEQIINEQTDREIAEKLYENRIEELKSAHQVMEAKHLSKIAELETRLEMLNSFSEEKEESERNLKVLMNKLEEERNQFRVNTESIENRFLVERDKLRKTYDQKYEQIKKELEDSVENKMSNKTKKTQLMNVIMKKELDSQSQHAEKLLEINEAMLERDKALKLELDVATSLNKDMTMRLAMTQRTIKQLNEKVAVLDATEAANRQQHEAALHEKVEALIQLEAKLKNVNKKTSSENNKLDEMWHFLAQSFQMLKTAKKKKGQQAPPVKDSLEEHEQLLVGLVKEVLRRYPQLLQEIGPIAAGNEPSQQLQQPQSNHQHMIRESSASPPPSVSITTSWIMQSQSSLSATTGIPAWDMKTFDSGSRDNPNQRSIAVQTEGKVAPYPDGSLWMEAPGARSLYFQQQSAALAAAAAASMDGDNSSVGFNSVQSLWRSADRGLAGGGGGGGMGITSLASSDDNYSAKTASHVLQAPPRGKTKSSKIISKMRRKNMRNVGSNNANSGTDFDDLPRHINLQQPHQPQQQHHQQASYMTIEGETLYAGGNNNRSKGYYGTAGAISSNNSHVMPRTPVSLDLTSPSPVFPSPLSLGSSAQLLLAAAPSGGAHNYGHSLGANNSQGMRPSPWLSNALLGGTAGSFIGSSGLHSKHQHHQQQPFSPTMSISGQGFVAPLVLPKLS